MATKSDKVNGYQVLNISNVNSNNEIMLNDEMLLRFIQMYPFLYNPHIKPQNDPDYEAWAWERIAKSFNRTYENFERNVWFTTTELIERWNVLKPIVKNLCKVNVIKSLPEGFREVIIKMNIPAEDVIVEPMTKQLTPTQEMIMKHLPMVKNLSIAQRRCLEAEVLELILKSELDSKTIVRLGGDEEITIQREYEELMKSLDLNEFYAGNLNEQESGNESETATCTENSTDAANGLKVIVNEENIKLDIDYENDFILPDNHYDKNHTENVRASHTDEIKEEENLLEPLPLSNWIPLHKWRSYVRKCRVRIKRVDVEDDIPLARIKKERKF